MYVASSAPTPAPEFGLFSQTSEIPDADIDDANIAEDPLLFEQPEFPAQISDYDTFERPVTTHEQTPRSTSRISTRRATETGAPVEAVEYVPQLPWRIRIGYSLGELGLNSANQLLGFYKNLFLLDVALLPASVVAIVLLVSTVWDAFTDLMFGSISDQTRSVFGRRRPYILLGSIIYAGLFYAFFQSPLPPTDSGPNLIGREAYYFVCYFLFKTASTLYSIPYYALVAEITSSYTERTKLTSMRTAVSLLFGLAIIPLWSVITTSFPLEQDPSQPNLQMGYSVASLLMIPLLIYPALPVFSQIKEPVIPPAPKRKLTWQVMVRSVFHNRAFLFTLAIFLSANMASQFVTNNLALYVKYVLFRENQLSFMLLLLQGTTIFSLAIWTPLANRLGKNYTFMISVICFVVPLGISWIQDPETPLAAVLALFAVAGFGVGGLLLLPWSMMGDCVDVDELSTGTRREGLYFGLFVLFQKIALAAALTGANYALDATGYINHLPGDENPLYQPPAVIEAFKVMVGPVSCGIAALSLIPAFFYPLTSAKHARLLEQLREQRRFRAATKRATLTQRQTHLRSPSKIDSVDLSLEGRVAQDSETLLSDSERRSLRSDWHPTSP